MRSLPLSAFLSVILLPAALAGPVISEFLASNDSGQPDEDGEFSDWIEIRNPDFVDVELLGWALTDDASDLQKWIFPDVTLQPGDHLVVFASGKDRSTAGEQLHTNFSLKRGGEFLALLSPASEFATQFSPTYPPQFTDVSFGTGPGDPTPGFFTTPTPGDPNGPSGDGPVSAVDFSPGSQVFDTSVSVTLSHPAPGATIYYTTDGTEPTAATGSLYSSPLTVSSTTRVRTFAQLPGGDAGPVSARHFLKLAPDTQGFSSPLPIVVLDNFGSGAVPQRATSSGPNGNDGSRVFQVPRQPALMAIYEPGQLGPASPAAAPTIVTHAGLRVRGSSSASLAKKSFSIEAWKDGEIENAKNIAPFGLPSESDWVLYAPTEAFSGNRYDRPLLHNSFIYQLSNEIGRYAARTQFVEVFLNTGGGDLSMADYAGLYVFMETVKRDEDRVDFKEMSTDGSSGGWMINVDRMDPLPIDGRVLPRHFHTPGPNQVLETPNDSRFGVRNIDDHPEFYHSFFNFESPGGYALTPSQRTVIESELNAFEDALYGPSWTDPVLGYAAWIDVDSFIDHYILQNLTKNQDAFVLSTWIYRPRPTARMKFGPIWDFDRGYTTSPTNTNPASNLLWAANRMWFPRLFADPDFEQRYIDRWQDLRAGAFATGHINAIIDAQRAAITDAVALRNGTANWPGKVAAMKSWLATRTAAIDAQFLAKPTFNLAGGPVPIGSELAISAGSGTTVYYTTDGSDPRLSGGNVSPLATAFPGGAPGVILPESRTIIARSRLGTEWSGPTQSTFVVGTTPAAAGNLVVSEIMYDPLGPTTDEIAAGIFDGDQFEYIELLNIGPGEIDLSGLSFADGLIFTFPAGPSSLLPPGERILVIKNQVAFEFRHGIDPTRRIAGAFAGDTNLRDSGERLELRGPDDSLIRALTYNDQAPWPEAADDSGYSLVLDLPFDNPDHDLPISWRSSAAIGGSPGALDTFAFAGDPAADLDGDGLTRLLEYALATSDSDPSSGPDATAVSIESFTLPEGTENYLVFSFHRNLAAEDTRYTIEHSSDLVTWATGLATLLEEINLGDGSAIVRYRYPFPVSAGQSGHLRLRVNLN